MNSPAISPVRFAWPLQGYKVLARPLWVTAVFPALEFYSWSSTRGSKAGLWALPTSTPARLAAFQHTAFWGGTGQQREVESDTRELLLWCVPCRELQLQHTWHRPLLLIILSFKMRGKGLAISVIGFSRAFRTPIYFSRCLFKNLVFCIGILYPNVFNSILAKIPTQP